MCCCGLNFGILFTLLYILTLACAVEIMNYLKEKLDGNAAEVILGLALTNVNYDEAIKLLKERFGQNDIIINTRYTISSWIYLLHPPTQVPYVPTMTK